MKNVKIIETGDGSHSLLHESLNETYHSRHGAIAESQYVFIEKGLKTLKGSADIRILEFGFGTGLNALLTALYFEDHHAACEYISLDHQFFEAEVWQRLNFCKELKSPSATAFFEKIHQAPLAQNAKIHDRFYLLKRQLDFTQAFDFSTKVDLVYFDAFAPNYHPEAWEREVLQKAYDCLKTGGVFVTYCAQGALRRNLKDIGFEVERLPGPPGKREMLRGTKAGVGH